MMGLTKTLLGALCFLGCIFNVQASSVPVIFVHGFLGFGEDEAFGIAYFGYMGEFEAEGFTTHAASVGPVSSNWDRACELYAQIKGTKVDYGVAHSSTYGHASEGKDYSAPGVGFYPSWSPSNPIHLVGHSMGGQTIRMLEILLQEGDQAEQNAGGPSGAPTSDLFTGGNSGMIKSITTLSAPHDGTNLVDILGPTFVGLIRDFIIFFAGFVDDSFVEQIYDFDLDHWGVARNNGESPNDYWNRLEATVLSDDNDDLAPFDLSPAGALVQNQRGQQAYPGTHYFSFASEDTFSFYACFWFLRCGTVQNPEISMNLLLQPFAFSLGSIDQPVEQRKNDGVVNWENQKCPSIGYGGNAKGNCEVYRGTWDDGKWYYMDVPYLDHLQTATTDFIRDTISYSRSAKKLYRDHAQRIKVLDIPTFVPQEVQPALIASNVGALIDIEDPSDAGAIVLISTASVLSIMFLAGFVRVRRLRHESGAAAARNPSFLQTTPKLSFGSRKGSKASSRKDSKESARAYSTPNLNLGRNDSYSTNYSQQVEHIDL